MASNTKEFTLTPNWQDIAEGNIYLFVDTDDDGIAEVFYGTTAPTASDIGMPIKAGQGGMSIEIGGSDVVYARVINENSMKLRVIQRAA